MKAAIFTDTYEPQISGVTNTISHMEKYFQKRQIEYKIFAPDYKKNTNSSQVEQFYSIRFLLYPECRLSLVNQWRVNRIISEFKPDIIHMITEFNMGWSGLSCAKRYNIPSISTYTTNFPHYLKYYKLEVLKDLVWDYFRWYHNQSNLTLCPSDETKTLLLKNGVSKVELFGRGIDTDLYSPKKRKQEVRKQLGCEDKILLLYVGRISVEKDLHILFEAFKRLQTRTDKRIALILAGDGPMLEKFKELYEGTDIIFTGYLKGEPLAELYASADIFAFPSSTETFGNVVLEAMASGLPVVGVNSGGVKENITHEITGFLQEPGSVSSFLQGLETLIEQDRFRMNMRNAARHYALTKTWDYVFDSLIEKYHQISNKNTKKIA